MFFTAGYALILFFWCGFNIVTLKHITSKLCIPQPNIWLWNNVDIELYCQHIAELQVSSNGLQVALYFCKCKCIFGGKKHATEYIQRHSYYLINYGYTSCLHSDTRYGEDWWMILEVHCLEKKFKGHNFRAHFETQLMPHTKRNKTTTGVICLF